MSGKESDQRSIDLVRAYGRLFETEDGQTVLYDLMEKGHFLSPTHDDVKHAADRNEGKRELVLYILRQCSLDVAKVLELIKNEQYNKDNYIM